jgi:hypothetical protein
MSKIGNSSIVTAIVGPRFESVRRRRDERRQRQRLKVSLPARLRPFSPEYWRSEEVQTTLNFTRNGLYFVTWTEHYSLGMRVLVTLPYSSAASAHRDYLGQIVRLERLKDSRWGVALQFLF